MIAIAFAAVAALVSLLITRVATVALVLTGMSQQDARFQARSALSGTGFTTSEAEQVVNHPVRRRIVMGLMMLGSAGLVTGVATVMLGFVHASSGEALQRVGVILGALLALYLLSRSPWFDRRLSRLIAALLRRFTDIESRDYGSLLHLAGDYGVAELAVREGEWLAGHSLDELDLRSEGVAVLGVERADGTFLGAPRFDTVVCPGDTLVLYGPQARIDELDDRVTGVAGDQAHRLAVAEQRRREEAECAADDAAREPVASRH